MVPEKGPEGKKGGAPQCMHSLCFTNGSNMCSNIHHTFSFTYIVTIITITFFKTIYIRIGYAPYQVFCRLQIPGSTPTPLLQLSRDSTACKYIATIYKERLVTLCYIYV